MPYINYSHSEMTFKIVYYGPGMGGKTTNIAHIHRVVEDEKKGKLLVLDTDQERTLFFDFLPLDLGRVGDFSIRLNIYTVPGQVYYEASRRLIVEGADGIVFVADSQHRRLRENLDSFGMLQENLNSCGIEWARFPIVLQYNKRDLPGLLPVGTMENLLGLNGVPVVEAIATKGLGVVETIKIASRMVIQRFQM